MTNEPIDSNQGKRIEYLSSLPIPYPYLISAMDQYYGVSPHWEEEFLLNKNQVDSNVPKRKTDQGKSGKKLRILLTTFWDYPVVGGLQNYLTTLKRGLEELGHSVDIIAPNQFPEHAVHDLHKEIGTTNKEFYMNRYGCYSQKILSQDQYLYSYEMTLRNMNLDKYDIFHAQDRFTANIVGRLNQYYQKPLFFTPHGFMTHRKLQFHLIQKDSVEEAYYFQIDKKAIETADQVIILCEAFRPILKKLGADDQKMTTIYSGIDFPPIKRNKQAKIGEDKVIITCIARLGPRKGHKYLIEALALLKNEIANADVLIVGDGPMREELENQVQTLDLSNVHFLGTRIDIPELLHQSDIFVLPTTSDTLPISIIEAMFGQQAIITTNCGGIPEIIKNNHSGIIVEPGNSKQLAEKLLLLLRDVKVRETLAGNARAYAETHLTATNMVRKIEKIYLSFL